MKRWIERKGLAILAMSAGLLAATGSWAVAQGAHGQVALTAGRGATLSMQPMNCSQQESGTLATIGRLAPGHNASELTGRGV